jgi:hypothetical protein
MATTYRSYELTLAATQEDRHQWDAITDQPRQLAIAADKELRRRHPGHKLPPLQSAEPEPVTEAEQAQLSLTPGGRTIEIAQWITELREQHSTFHKLVVAQRSEHQDADLRQPLPYPTRAWTDAILQPPPPAITPTWKILQAGRVADREAEADR